MDISITESGDFLLKKVFNPVQFKTEEGFELSVCMREGGFEIMVWDLTKGLMSVVEPKTYRVDTTGFVELGAQV